MTRLTIDESAMAVLEASAALSTQAGTPHQGSAPFCGASRRRKVALDDAVDGLNRKNPDVGL
jgi:hypothetical protein